MMRTRRRFLRAGALLAAGAGLSARSWARVIGANGDVRVAVVGLNGKGRDHVRAFQALPGVRVVALCDVDSATIGKVFESVAEKSAARPAESVFTCADYRRLLERADIDAVSIVTPNHQHALQAIWALQAGKDVFLEKPVSHDLWEGQQLVRAAAKYRRVLQAGMQNRSSPAIAQALAWQRAGHIGKVIAARGFCFKRRASIGKTVGPQPLPASLDYDLWLGPAPHAPLRRARLHYDWHWQWATGNGDIGNQGNHQLDVARRFLGETSLPPRVQSWGGRFGYEDDGETPNTLVVSYEYANAPIIFELRGLPASPSTPETMDGFRGLSVGNIIDCEGGYLEIPARDYSSARAFDRAGQVLAEFSGTASHYRNFIDAVRSRRTGELNAPILEGHLSSALSHLANISLRVTHGARDVGSERRPSHALAAEAYERMRAHLLNNGVDLRRSPLAHGALLELDPATEQFLGRHAAAALRFVKREYRPPFVVPEIG